MTDTITEDAILSVLSEEDFHEVGASDILLNMFRLLSPENSEKFWSIFATVLLEKLWCNGGILVGKFSSRDTEAEATAFVNASVFLCRITSDNKPNAEIMEVISAGIFQGLDRLGKKRDLNLRLNVATLGILYALKAGTSDWWQSQLKEWLERTGKKRETVDYSDLYVWQAILLSCLSILDSGDELKDEYFDQLVEMAIREGENCPILEIFMFLIVGSNFGQNIKDIESKFLASIRRVRARGEVNAVGVELLEGAIDSAVGQIS